MPVVAIDSQNNLYWSYMQNLDTTPIFTTDNYSNFADPKLIECLDVVITNGGFVYIDCHDLPSSPNNPLLDYFFVANILTASHNMTFYNAT